MHHTDLPVWQYQWGQRSGAPTSPSQRHTGPLLCADVRRAESVERCVWWREAAARQSVLSSTRHQTRARRRQAADTPARGSTPCPVSWGGGGGSHLTPTLRETPPVTFSLHCLESPIHPACWQSALSFCDYRDQEVPTKALCCKTITYFKYVPHIIIYTTGRNKHVYSWNLSVTFLTSVA